MKKRIFSKATLWLAAASMLLIGAGCSENDEPQTPDTKIDPPTIEFAQQIQIDETGEWPVAKVEVAVSSDAQKWFWKFEETRAYQDWTMIEASRTQIEFPVLYTGDYTLSIYAENAGGQSDVKTQTFHAAIPEKYGEVFAAIGYTINDAKDIITFDIRTTESTSAWYWEFAELDNATELPETVTSVPEGFEKGTDSSFALPYSVNTAYKMTVIATNGSDYTATSATVSTDWAEPVIEVLNAAFDYRTETYGLTLKPSSATTRYYYYFGNIDASEDGGAIGGDPYSLNELLEFVEAREFDMLKEYGFVECEGNAQLELAFEFGTGKDYRYNNIYTPYGFIAIAENQAGFSEVKSMWPISPKQLFYFEPSIEVTGPWTANVSINKADGCARYVIGAMSTHNTITSDDIELNDGYDEEKFIEEAKMALQTVDNGYNWSVLPYCVYTGQWNEIDELHLRHNNSLNEKPQGLHFRPETEYTLAIYAVTTDGDAVVYTYPFKTKPYTNSDSTPAPVLTLSRNGLTDATVTIDAGSAEKIFYGYSQPTDENLDNGAVTDAVVESIFTDNLSGTYFEEYDAPIQFSLRKNNRSDSYIVWAVAIDRNGNISHVASQTVAPKEITHDSAAAITSCDFLSFTSSDFDDYSGTLNIALGLTPEVAKVRIVDVTGSVKPETVTQLENWLIADNGVALVYTREEALAADFNIWYSHADEFHWLFAMTEDAEGNFGKIVNLADVTLETDNAEFMNKYYWYTGPFGQGGDDYWTHNIKGAATGWLKYSNFSGAYGDFACDITWDADAEGMDQVSKMYILRLTSTTSALVNDIKDAFDGYSPDKAADFTPATAHQIVDNPKVPQVFHFEHLEDSWATFPCSIFAIILADADGNLTMMAYGFFDDMYKSYVRDFSTLL